MSTPHPQQDSPGGFARPQFTQAGEQSPAPAVDQHIAQQQGSKADIVAENEQRQAEHRELNRQKRRGFLLAALSVVVVVVIIVAVMIWLWSTEVFVTP